uniref:X-C motif chemokine receptor 1 n=1 Tax=Myripristis murdjan TaxID=586833 RepID=A0A667YVH6_9TELE
LRMDTTWNDSVYIYDWEYEDELCDNGRLVNLTGNILVLVILALYENFKSLTNVFILNLAIADLLLTAGLPFWAIYHTWGWIMGDVLCKIVAFIFFTGFYSSILFLTIMTIHRYLAVVHPVSEFGSQRLSYGVIISVVLWMMSIGAAMPSLLYSSIAVIHHTDKEYCACEYKDLWWRKFIIYQQNIFFLIAFAMMTFCYVRILGRIVGTRSHMRNRTVKLIFCIVALFFLSWIPYNVTIFLQLSAAHFLPTFNACEAAIRLDYAFAVITLVLVLYESVSYFNWTHIEKK